MTTWKRLSNISGEKLISMSAQWPKALHPCLNWQDFRNLKKNVHKSLFCIHIKILHRFICFFSICRRIKRHADVLRLCSGNFQLYHRGWFKAFWVRLYSKWMWGQSCCKAEVRLSESRFLCEWLSISDAPAVTKVLVLLFLFFLGPIFHEVVIL